MPLHATIVIGRFQPFHKGHLSIIKKAMEQAPKTFVLLGSHNVTRTPKNVWTTEERLQMMCPCFTERELARLTFLPIDDYPQDSDWVEHVQLQLADYLPPRARVGLLGFLKDESSYYLQMFHRWSFIQAEKFYDGLSATDLRNAYFDNCPPNPAYLPDPVVQFLCDFRKTTSYETMRTIIKETSQPFATPISPLLQG